LNPDFAPHRIYGIGDNRAAHSTTCYNLGNEVKSLFFW